MASARSRLFGNIGWLFADRVFRMGAGLLVGVWMARYLGPADFGLLNYVMALAALFTTIGGLGLNDIVVRDLISQPESAGETMGTAVALQAAGGAVAYVMAVGSVILLRPGEPQTWMVMALCAISLLGQCGDVIRGWFDSRVESRVVVWVANATFAGITLLRVAFILTGKPLPWFALLAGLDILLTTVALLVVFYRYRAAGGAAMSHWTFSSARAVRMLKVSWPLALTGIAITLNMRIDQVMLGQFVDDKAVGLFSAAVRLSEVWYFIPVAIVVSAFPFIAGEKDPHLVDRRWQQLYAVMIWLSIAAGLFATFFGGLVLTALFGSAFESAGPVLTVHIWGGMNVAVGLVWSRWIVVENQSRLFLFVQVLGAVINIGLNYLWIPAFGIMGAAYATLASYWISGLTSYLIYKPSVTFGHLAAAFMPWRLLDVGSGQRG